MKLGEFETTADGAIRNAYTREIRANGGTIAQQDLVEFVRELHAAHARGEVWVISDPPGPPDLGNARAAVGYREAAAVLDRIGCPHGGSVRERIEWLLSRDPARPCPLNAHEIRERIARAWPT